MKWLFFINFLLIAWFSQAQTIGKADVNNRFWHLDHRSDASAAATGGCLMTSDQPSAAAWINPAVLGFNAGQYGSATYHPLFTRLIPDASAATMTMGYTRKNLGLGFLNQYTSISAIDSNGQSRTFAFYAIQPGLAVRLARPISVGLTWGWDVYNEVDQQTEFRSHATSGSLGIFYTDTMHRDSATWIVSGGVSWSNLSSKVQFQFRDRQAVPSFINVGASITREEGRHAIKYQIEASNKEVGPFQLPSSVSLRTGIRYRYKWIQAGTGMYTPLTGTTHSPSGWNAGVGLVDDSYSVFLAIPVQETIAGESSFLPRGFMMSMNYHARP